MRRQRPVDVNKGSHGLDWCPYQDYSCTGEMRRSVVTGTDSMARSNFA